MNLNELVGKYGRDYGSSIHTILSPKTFNFSQLNNALLFVLAPWSAPSIQSLQALTRALRSNHCDVTLFVIDIDDLNQSSSFSEIGKICEGKGETFWISNGKVVHSAVISESQELAGAVEYTKQFIRIGDSRK